jgi:hypothetical protein
LDGDFAASPPLGIGLNAATVEHHQVRSDENVTATAHASGDGRDHVTVFHVKQATDSECYVPTVGRFGPGFDVGMV